jgi:hypothetical protein
MQKKPKAIMPPGARKRSPVSPLPPDLSVDDPHNWDFDVVPEAEQKVCCLWEYARESAFIRDTLQRVSLAWKMPDWVVEQEANTSEFWVRLRQNYGWVKPEEANQIDENLRTIGNCQITRDFFFPRDILLTGHAESFPIPWRSLTVTQRKERVGIVARQRKAKPVGGFRIANFPLVDNFARAVSEADRKANADAPPFKRIDPRIVTRWGSELLLIEIEWGRLSPDTIAQCFRKWVTTPANRPKCFSSRTGRPAGTFDPFAALDGLAIMRLLHHCKPSEAETKAPKLWQRHKGKQLFRTREAAHKTFRTIFPLLPKDERPLSWPTKAGRSR